MISLDHIAIWSRNLYRTTIELSRQTGIGSIDGGYFPTLGLGQKLISLGGLVYVEVESIVDHGMIADRARLALEVERVTATGDCFAGLCFRSDDLGEIEALARHRGLDVSKEILGGKERMVPDAKKRASVHAPDFRNSWLLGKPNIYYVPDSENHSSELPVHPGTGDVRGLGVTALELGGTEEGWLEWFGDADLSHLDADLTFNGGPDGLYAVHFDSTSGPQTIRLNPITL